MRAADAWDIVEKSSNGDETTKLSDTETSCDLPFFSSGDDKENTKGRIWSRARKALSGSTVVSTTKQAATKWCCPVT